MFNYDTNFLKAVLLLTIGVAGSFIGSTLSCKTQFSMTNNMYVKHLIIIFVIYFTLNFSTDNKKPPLTYMKNTLLIWIFYLLFTKQNQLFTGISASVLFGTYIMDTYVSYYDDMINNMKDEIQKNKIENTKNKLTNIRTFSFYSGIVLIIIGFILYMKDKYIEYGKNFNPLTFLLGKVDCNSLKTV